MSSVFVKFLVNDRFPKRSGDYHTDYGIAYFSHSRKKFYQEVQGDGAGTFDIIIAPEYWFEEVDLPSEDEVKAELIHPVKISANVSTLLIDMYEHSVDRVYNFILNKLKGETNG